MQTHFLDRSDLEASARPTSVPPFDPEAFARESESRLLAPKAFDTIPPPPRYPGSLTQAPLPFADLLFAERAPTELDPRLRDHALRFALLATALRAGALSREEAARVLRLELESLGAAAVRSHADSVGALAASLGEVIVELGGVAGEVPTPGREVVVLDANPETASLVALALESQWHRVRVVTCPGDLARGREADDPASVAAIFVAIAMSSDPTFPVSRMLREIVGNESLTVVLYGRASKTRLASLAALAEADSTLRLDTSFEELFEAVGALLDDLAPCANRSFG